MAKTKTKPYKETIVEEKYSKDYYDDSWEYPKNRVRVDLVDYEWEVEVKWEIKPYSGRKLLIRNQKLISRDWQVQVKQKANKFGYIQDDQQVFRISVDEFKDLVLWLNKKD